MPDSLPARLTADSAERKRAEAIRAVRAGRLAEPVTGSFLLYFALSAAFSFGSAMLTAALAKRQKVTRGDRGGQEFQVQRIEQGAPIPEVYGADPGDGLGGGVKLAPFIVWLSRDAQGNVARKHVTKSRPEGGGKGRPKAPDVETITYDLDALLLWGKGRLTLKRLWAGPDTIYRTYGGPVEYYEAEAGGNTKAGGAANVADGSASGGSAVTIPQNGSLRWNGVEGDGTAARLEFYLKTSAPVTVHFEWVGGAGTTTFNADISSTGGVYNLEYASAPWILASGSVNTVKVTNLSADAIVFDRLGVRVSGGPTGVPSSDIDPDEPYDPDSPHSPNVPDKTPTARFSDELLADGDGVTVGSVQAGSYAGIAHYEGAPDQLPDAVVEAAVDAIYGEGSTPAYRGRSTTRLSNFYLTRYQEVFPPMSGLLENRELTTLADIFGHWCERAGLTPDDYDFSDLASINVRGFVVSPPYTPKEAMTALAGIFNVYFYESDKIYGLRMESAPTFAVEDSELGWVDESPDGDAVQPELGGEIPAETTVPRRVSIRYYDPTRNYEQNVQGEVRQVTTGQREDVLEVQLVMTADEAREAAQRELYQEDVESVPHTFSLSYEHIYRNPGDLVTVTRAEGFTHLIRITTIRPAIGAVECEGVAVDTAAFTQPVSTSPGDVFEVPPVAIPGATLIGLYDGPALRTEDEGRAGFIVWPYKRMGDGDWPGGALYKMVEGEAQLIVVFDTQATAGVTVTALGDWSDTDSEDSARTFTADAGTDALTSTAHELEDGETVMVSNSGGALPAGLSSSTLYYVRDSAADTLKLALTAGGSAVDITSAGTGTHSIQRVIEVDLHDQETTLESVTADQIENGANAFLAGDEVVQVRTWELVAGHQRRWRGRNITRGLRSTEPFTGTHSAGERFVLLDSAVKFVPQDVGELDIEREYKAVTAGQSLDDAATVEFTWTGGTLKYPAPSILATKDTNGDWRFRLYGLETRDPEGERYHLEIVGGRSFMLRGAASRAVSLSSSSALPGDDPLPPVGGKARRQYRAATLPGNSVPELTTGFVTQLIQGERTALSATYHTDLTADSVTDFNLSTLTFTPGQLHSFTLNIYAQTSTSAGSLSIVGNHMGEFFTDTTGEATGTRYTVEFKDGKVYFFRNRGLHSEPFCVHTPPDFTQYSDPFFPAEAQVSAGADSSWTDIEIDDEGAALVYPVSAQEQDFGSAQASLTVRANQQRVVEGVVVDGQVVEAEFP